MSDQETSVCSTCGAKIVWWLTPTQKLIPVDPTPLLGGNMIEVGPGKAQFLTRIEVMEMKESDIPAYQSHFVSCADATAHRRR